MTGRRCDNRYEDNVLDLNASEYGLAGSIWSDDAARASEIAERLETGAIWINESQHLLPWTPFGGHKQSGIGVENGMAGLLANPQTITVCKI
jgi:acyl-CoA reductase-like NAD-dependent aldehyde dehydrogenase